MRVEVPPGECHTGYGGYPWTQLETIFPPATVKALEQWMHGQTMMICDGAPERDWVGGELVEVGPSRCDQAHGTVIYEWDLHDFLGGRPTRD